MQTTTGIKLTPRVKSYIMLFFVSVIWGVATPIIKFTLEGFEPGIFLAYRFGLSTLAAALIFTFFGVHLPKDKNSLLLVFAYGFLNSVVSLGFLFFGMKNTTVLETGLITMASPLIVSSAGVYFLNEKLTKREKLGMAIAILGTLFTIIDPLINNGHGSLKFSGNILVFGYVLSTVVTSIIVKKLLKKDINPLTITNISFIIGFISFGIVTLINTPPVNLTTSILGTPFKYHLGVIYMALISGTLAFYLSNRAQKSIEIGEQSLFSYLYPVFSVPLAIFWLGEKVSPYFIFGAVIIIIGVVIAEVKKKRYNSSS